MFTPTKQQVKSSHDTLFTLFLSLNSNFYIEDSKMELNEVTGFWCLKFTFCENDVSIICQQTLDNILTCHFNMFIGSTNFDVNQEEMESIFNLIDSLSVPPRF